MLIKIWNTVVDFFLKELFVVKGMAITVWMVAAVALLLLVIIDILICRKIKKAKKKAKQKATNATIQKDTQTATQDFVPSTFAHEDGEIEYFDEPAQIKEIKEANISPAEANLIEEAVQEIETEESKASQTKEKEPKKAKSTQKEESNSEVKEEPKPENKPQPKEVKEEPKAETKVEVKKEPKAEVKEEVKEEPKAESKAESKPEPKKEEPIESKPEPTQQTQENAQEKPKSTKSTAKKPATKSQIGTSEQAAAVAQKNEENSSKGKYVIYRSKGGCRFFLQANNGVNVYESDVYASIVTCKNAINTFKSNVEKNNFEVKKLETGEWTYLIKRANGSYEGKRYLTESQAKAGVASVKRLYKTDYIKQIEKN